MAPANKLARIAPATIIGNATSSSHNNLRIHPSNIIKRRPQSAHAIELFYEPCAQFEDRSVVAYQPP
jgi:hypothetical protein